MGDTLLQYDLMEVIKPHPAFIWPLERTLEAEGWRQCCRITETSACTSSFYPMVS
jgi:hypothetical protein